MFCSGDFELRMSKDLFLDKLTSCAHIHSGKAGFKPSLSDSGCPSKKQLEQFVI
jgi:hypothetical protein